MKDELNVAEEYKKRNKWKKPLLGIIVPQHLYC